MVSDGGWVLFLIVIVLENPCDGHVNLCSEFSDNNAFKVLLLHHNDYMIGNETTDSFSGETFLV
jgi:hypothetical protein